MTGEDLTMLLLAIVLLVFALHVVAWLVLPAGRAHVDRAAVRLHRHVATTMPMGAPMEG
jgi:hypothetical protein